MRDLYHLYPAALDQKHCEDIIAAAEQQPAHDGKIFSTADDMQSLRSSRIRWMIAPWIQEMLWGYVEQANRQSFGVTVDNKAEIQFTEYHAAKGGHYGWHHDVQWSAQDDYDRKLSVTVQLSDRSDYDGGGFEFDEVTTNADFTAIGSILVFPSYLRHRVLPVTSGVRRSLVAWFSGPRWQ